MSAMMSRASATAVLVVDALGSATLTDIARISGLALSTIQRGVQALTKSGVLGREWDRGPFSFAPGVPRSALREIADWSLGPKAAKEFMDAARAYRRADSDAPPTITNPRIRRAWPHALRRIVTTYHPRRVVLFGSQATGKADNESDVDLLVVFDQVADRRERGTQITGLLRDMPFAKDVLVAGPDDLAHPLRGSAVADAIKTGVVVYER